MPGRLYAAVSQEGVFSIEEGDSSWALLGGRFFPWWFTALAADPHDPCRVYVGVHAGSLLAFTHSGTAEFPGEP